MLSLYISFYYLILKRGTIGPINRLPEEPKEGALALKPANMTYEEAAAVLMGDLKHVDLILKTPKKLEGFAQNLKQSHQT